MKEETSKYDFILNGIHIGEHGFNKDKVIDEIKRECVDKGMNYVVIRPEGEVGKEYFIKWAKYCADNDIYFAFLYSIIEDKNGELVSYFDKETVSEMNEAGGKYFLGDSLGEPGSSYTFKGKKYFTKSDIPKQNLKDLQEAREQYINLVKSYVKIDKNLGIDNIACVEASVFSKYNLDAGVTIPVNETMVGNPERILSCLRGSARANNIKLWGTYFPGEWYAGKWHEDILKQKRIELSYKYAYLAGSKIFCLESGLEMVNAYGENHKYDSDVCRHYRNTLKLFNDMVKKDFRPAGGPKVKIAFVYGNNDGWGGLTNGSTLWAQFDDESWGCAAPEYSWKILEDITVPSGWYDTENFGPVDLSGQIPMGQYDVIPAESNADVLSNYDYIIFVGWNSMTYEIYDNLTKYVENGGNLFITAAHLNTSIARNGEYKVINGGDLSHLFGCKICGGFKSPGGFKFARKGIDGIHYAGAVDYTKNILDPLYGFGYAHYAKVKVCGGEVGAVLSEGFFPAENSEDTPPVLIENRCKKGVARLLTSIDYPGHGAIYHIYRILVESLLNHCHQNSDLIVFGNSKLRYAVYEGNVVYLLNTDFDCDICANVIYRGEKQKIMLKPCELKRLEI